MIDPFIKGSECRAAYPEARPCHLGESGAKAATYAYDKAGNTTGRPGTQATQTLAWNTEGELASTTEPAAGSKPALGTTYLYGADGELLIRRATGDGDTVLCLGATEVRLTTKGATKTISGTRYYSAAGQTLAVRTTTSGTTGSKLSFLAADHHGTSSIAMDATTQDVTKRYTTPFGASRGAKSTAWPDGKAFLGKPADTTTGRTPEIAINDKSAIDSGHPFLLHYGADKAKNKQNRELAGCGAAWRGAQSCDEYPPPAPRKAE